MGLSLEIRVQSLDAELIVYSLKNGRMASAAGSVVVGILNAGFTTDNYGGE